MVRLIIILFVVAILWLVWRSIAKSFRQWREGRGEMPESPLPAVPSRALDSDALAWQVTSALRGTTACVAVEHPAEGVWHEWKIQLRAPHAEGQLDSALSSAEGLRDHLNGGNDGVPSPV